MEKSTNSWSNGIRAVQQNQTQNCSPFKQPSLLWEQGRCHVNCCLHTMCAVKPYCRWMTLSNCMRLVPACAMPEGATNSPACVSGAWGSLQPGITSEPSLSQCPSQCVPHWTQHVPYAASHKQRGRDTSTRNTYAHLKLFVFWVLLLLGPASDLEGPLSDPSPSWSELLSSFRD